MIRCFRLIVISVLLAGQALLFLPLSGKAQLKPGAGPIVVSGVVVAVHQATLSCRMPARIVGVNVDENRQVRRGQLLVQLDDSELRAQLNTAKAALAAANALLVKARAGGAAQEVKANADVATAISGLQEARRKRDAASIARDSIASETAADLKTAKQGVTKATLALSHAKKTLADLETLDKVGGVSRNDLESGRMQVTLAQLDLDNAAAGVNKIKEGRGGVPFRVASAQDDVTLAQQGVDQADKALYYATGARDKLVAINDADMKSARASIQQARAGVNSSSDAISAMRLISPIDGIAASVSARVGETAQSGVPLVTIVSLKNLRVDALVLARNIPQVRVGMHVSISVDTQPGRCLDAVVSEIARVAERDQRSIRVRFRLTGSTALRPGLGAKIVIGGR